VSCVVAIRLQIVTLYSGLYIGLLPKFTLTDCKTRSKIRRQSPPYVWTGNCRASFTVKRHLIHLPMTFPPSFYGVLFHTAFCYWVVLPVLVDSGWLFRVISVQRFHLGTHLWAALSLSIPSRVLILFQYLFDWMLNVAYIVYYSAATLRWSSQRGKR